MYKIHNTTDICNVISIWLYNGEFITKGRADSSH